MNKIKNILTDELFRIILGISLFVSAIVVDYLQRHYSFSLFAAVLYIAALLIVGSGVFLDAIKGILRRDLLDEKFLMSIASIGAMIIGDMREGVAVMLFFLIGEYFEHKAVAGSRKSIRNLMDIRPDEVTVLENGVESIVDADEVEVGTTIIIKSGERVPIDAVIISGNADLDTAALTGESLWRAVGTGDEINSGSIVIGGVLICQTIRLAEDSAASRILDLVENATEHKSKEENFITVFSRFYTPIVVALALIMATLPPLFTDSISWTDAIYRALTFLVISCPCALVISVPMAFFGGIGGAASKGVLFKGGNIFSALSKADSFVFDKTGTLTTGKFTITGIKCFDINEDKLLYYAASAEFGSTHPIAQSVKIGAKEYVTPQNYLEIAGRGVKATVDFHEVLVGNALLLEENGINVPHPERNVLFVAIDGRLSGIIEVSDTIKSDVKDALADLKLLGVRRFIMLSGDKSENAKRVASEIGLSEYRAELLPHQKYEELEKIISESRATVYVGDGINDAPSLARADVGVAMGGIGSDSAIESADVVIMTDSIKKLATAMKTARKTLRIAKGNIFFAIFVKALVLILSAIGFANMWLAVFADVGVAVLAILNSMRALSVKE